MKYIQKIKLSNIIIGTIVPIIILLLWEIGVKNGTLPKSIIASPSDVAVNFVKLLSDNTLLFHIFQSFKRLFCGFIVGSTIGISLGISGGISKTFKKLFEPTLLLLIPVPPLAWIPILIIFFGTDDLVKISLIAVGCAGTLFLATTHGVATADKNIIELSLIYGKNKFQTISKILLPATFPQVFSGLRVAMALSWTLLMASEMIKASSGIGWFINDSRNFSRPDDLIVAIITVGILGKLTDYLILFFDNHINQWREITTNE